MSERLSAAQWQRLDPVLLKLHSERDLHRLQDWFLCSLEELMPHERSFFDLCAPRQGRLFFFDPVSRNMTRQELEAYYQEYQYSDYVAWSFAGDRPTVYRDSQMISPDAREASAIYRQWMQPMGVYYSMGCTVMGKDHLVGSVTLFRSREHGDFTEQEQAMLEVLNRHLSAHLTLLWPGGPAPAGGAGVGRLAERCRLSPRESEIAALICAGSTNQAVGRALFISENTVKKHLLSIYRKLGISSRTQLLRMAYGQPAVLVPAEEDPAAQRPE